MTKLNRFRLRGQKYVRDGTRRYPADRPDIRGAPLKRTNLGAASDGDARELLGLAIKTRGAGALTRAERLARKVLAIDPENMIAAAIVSSILRERRRPKAALAITDRFQASGDAPVLTTRGAALCDVECWDEALQQIRQALVIEVRSQGAGSEHALAVLSRIKGSAPHLFPEDYDP